VKSAIGLSLAIVVSFAILGCSSAKKEAQKALDRGQIHLQQNDLSQAAAEFRKVVELLPDNVDAQLLLADTYVRMGNTEDAVAECNKILAARPKNEQALKTMGLALLQAAAKAGDRDKPTMEKYLNEASKLTDRLMERRPAAAYLLRAQVQLVRQEQTEALQLLEKAVEMDGTLSDARLSLASLYAENAFKRTAEAREAYRRKALEHYRKIIEVDKSREYTARMGIAVLALRSGNVGEAESRSARSGRPGRTT